MWYANHGSVRAPDAMDHICTLRGPARARRSILRILIPGKRETFTITLIEFVKSDHGRGFVKPVITVSSVVGTH